MQGASKCYFSINGNGEIAVSYKFSCLAVKMPPRLGLAFEMPKEFKISNISGMIGNRSPIFTSMPF